jgi:predicted DNA-binding transcriptional regulator AlpA
VEALKVSRPRPTVKDSNAERAAAGAFVAASKDSLLNSTTADVQKKPRGPPVPKLGLSIAEFAAAVGISVSYLYELIARGEGPRMMTLGTRRIIFVEEALRWCREHTAAGEQASATPIDAKEKAPAGGPGLRRRRSPSRLPAQP